MAAKPASIGWIEIGKRTWKGIGKNDVFGRSAELSYYFFLATFPLLICIVTLLAIFSGSGHILNGLLHYFGTVLPGSAYALIQQVFAKLTTSHAHSSISLRLIFSLWSASAGMSAIMSTLNTEYRVEESRGFIHRSAVAIGLTIAVAILLVAGIGAILVSASVAKMLEVEFITILVEILRWPVAVALMLLGFALIYFFAPDVKQRKWRWITPGAITGLAIWIAVSIGLKIYLQFFNNYNATYGSLGAVIILLLWFYLTGAAILIGAEINAVIEDAAAHEGVPGAKVRGEKATA